LLLLSTALDVLKNGVELVFRVCHEIVLLAAFGSALNAEQRHPHTS